MITVLDWAELRRLADVEGLSQRQIAKHTGLNRKTVARALASKLPPKYPQRVTGRPKKFDQFEAQVRVLLAQFPKMPATVLAERVGYEGSESVFRAGVARVRPDYRVPDPVDRLFHKPGEVAQCDLWFPDVRIGDLPRNKVPVLAMVAGYSRFVVGLAIPSRKTSDLLCGMELLLKRLGGVPGSLVWDNEPGIGRGRALTVPPRVFAATAGTEIKLLPPRDPESKGKIERMNGYFETSFLPGRSFSSIEDFNVQFTTWLERANTRKVRAVNARPVELKAEDVEAMRPLPDIFPASGFRSLVRLPRDYYVRVLGNDYSVHPSVIGRMVDVYADLSTVTVHHDGQLVGFHKRVTGTRAVITDPEHLEAAGRMRKTFRAQQRQAVAFKAEEVSRFAGLETPQIRDLSEYDEIFGLTTSKAVSSKRYPNWIKPSTATAETIFGEVSA